MACVKLAAAQANKELGAMDPKIADAEKAVIVDGKFGVGEGLGNRFLVAESPQGTHVMAFANVDGLITVGGEEASQGRNAVG